MAFTTGQTTAQMITEIQSVNTAINNDACLTFLSSLAMGIQAAVGTPVIFSGILIKCTTGYGTPSAVTAPVYAYDATPS